MFFKKIVHVSPVFFEDQGVIGGGERYPLELCKAMSGRVQTRLVSFSKNPRTERIGELEVRLFKPRFYVNGEILSPVQLSFLNALADADVIHCHQYHTLVTSLCILYARLFHKKIFISDYGGSGWDCFSYRLPMANFADGLFPLSQYQAKLFSSFKVKQRVVYGGVDEELFYPMNLPREKKALFVGRLLPHKGVRDLILAAGEDIPVKIICWPYSPSYFEELKKLSAGKQIEFAAGVFTEGPKFCTEYNTASVLVLPSVSGPGGGSSKPITELLGLVVLEAMACKTPVVVTDVCSLPELVEEGKTGFVVRPNHPEEIRDRILWIFNNPEKAREMGENAYRLFREKFTWDKVVDAILSGYEER